MNDGTTLRAFLERVDRQVVRLGPRDYLAVEELARSRQEWGPGELRAVLASVLARSSEQWSRIATLYDEVARAAVSEEEPDGILASGPEIRGAHLVARSAPRKAREHFFGWLTEARAHWIRKLRNAPKILWSSLIGFLVVAVAGLAAWMVTFSTEEADIAEPGKKADTAKLEAATEDDGVFFILLPDFDRELDPMAPRQPQSLELEVLSGLAFLSATLLVLGLFWIRLPDAQRARRETMREAEELWSEKRRREMQKAKALEGRALGVRYFVELYLPISRRAMLDSAELLGRIFGEAPGFDLDAEATLDRTLAAAGRFEPVMAPRLHRHDVVVLIDTEEGNHPWLAAFLRLVDAWEAQGVTFRRFTFSFSPGALIDAETNRAISLDELARQTEDLPLILFSRQIETLARNKAAGWMPTLAGWTRRAWLDPDPRPVEKLGRNRRRSIWELERQGLYRFRLGEEGVVLLARHLAGDGTGPRSMGAEPPLAGLPEAGTENPMAEGLRLWALVAALVPDPTWDQLEAIRRHFPSIHKVLPEHRCLQLLLDWVEEQSGGRSPELEGGRGLAIAPELQDRWLREQRRIEAADPSRAGFEDEARRLLLDQLRPTRPDDPMDREVWEFKVAMHEAMLEPDRAAELLSELGKSAVRHEAFRLLRAELARRDDGAGEPLPVGDRDVLARMVGEDDGTIPLRALVSNLESGWRFSWPVAAVGGLVAAFGILWLAFPGWAEHFEEEIRAVDMNRPAVYKIADSTRFPIMIEIPGASFQMGGKEFRDEQPIHTVEVPTFQISRAEVTVGQYGVCVEEGGCVEPDTRSSNSCNWGAEGRDSHPMNCVSWTEARKYAEWIGARLPTEAEWEYAARSAGSDREYPWGDTEPTCDTAVISGCSSGTEPVCSRPAGNTEQGLCDMAGNVWEWVEDDWHGSYDGAPADRSPWIESPRSSYRVYRGGSWRYVPRGARVANRDWDDPSRRYDTLGFRVARSLPSAL